MYWSDVAWSGWCASALFTSRIVCSQHDRWRYCQWYEFLRIIFNGIYYISYFCCCKCQVSTLGMKTRKLHQPILKHKTDTTWLCEKSCVTTNFICLANRCRLKCGCHWKQLYSAIWFFPAWTLASALETLSSIDTWMMRPARMLSVRNWDLCPLSAEMR